MVIAVLMIALALPVAMVLGAFRWQKPAPASAAPSVAEPLEKALATIVDKNLGGSEPLISSDREVAIFADKPEARARELEKTAAELGGTCLPAERQENAFRLVVSMPAGQLAAFNKALLGDGFAAGPKAAEGEAGVLVTILVKPKSAP